MLVPLGGRLVWVSVWPRPDQSGLGTIVAPIGSRTFFREGISGPTNQLLRMS